MRRTIALVTAVSMTGCSFFLTRGPDSVDKPTSDPDCTDSMTWPVVDGTLSGLLLISALAAASDDNMDVDGTSDSNDDAIGAFVLLGVASAAGAIVGYSRVSKCKTAQRKYRESYPYGNQPYPYGGYQPYPPQGYYPQQGYPPAQQGYPPHQPYPAAQQPYPPAAQPYPAQPAPPQPAQPAPAPPAAKPAPIPPWSPKPAPPPAAPAQPKVAPKAAPKPPPPPPPSAAGGEGDVCVADNECASGLTCTGNVCLKKKSSRPWPKKP